MKQLQGTLWISAAFGLFALALAPGAPASADIVHLDDVIIDGSACVGFDCVNGESFGFDTIRLKENNLRIKFDDTSTAASFPRNDWQLTANDSANGGANKFSIDDITGGRTPFTVEANARSHSLYVDDGGRIGIGTSTPVVEVHIKSGDTPTLRLEQDGTSGFAPQIWDVAGNETNYFIRDVSNGSSLPFRIRPGAPTSAIDLAGSGNVGIGTASPDASVHVRRTDGTAQLHVEDAGGGNATLMHLEGGAIARFDITNNTASQTWRFSVTNGGLFNFVDTSDGDIELSLSPDGDLTLAAGNCSDVAGGGGCTPDYVFEPEYSLRSLADLESFIEENKHLPNVPSGAEIDANGVNLRKLSFAMLEKIEELTLYTLQQQATIEDLSRRLDDVSVGAGEE